MEVLVKKELTLLAEGNDITKDFILNLVGDMTIDEEGRVIMDSEEYDFWYEVIQKEQKISWVMSYLTPAMREYVKSSYEHLYNTDIEDYPSIKDVEHALAQKLYEDLLIKDKGEGFAYYCAITAVEVLNGIYEDFDAVQDDLNSTIL